jgi:hypothetical protein
MTEQPNKWLVHHVPDDEKLLAALGRVSIHHGFLDLILKRTVKTLANITPEEADRALAYAGSREVRELIRKLAVRRLGKASVAVLRLQALLSECERVTARRNRYIHDVWAQDWLDDPVLIGPHDQIPMPSTAEVNQLADEIFAVASKINAARLHSGGFLYDALQELTGPAAIAEAKRAD